MLKISIDMDFSFSELNYNSVETLPGFNVRAEYIKRLPADKLNEVLEIIMNGNL